MGTFCSAEEAKEYFKKDAFALRSGITLEELGEDYAVCGVNVHEGLLNANGGVQGGYAQSSADQVKYAVIIVSTVPILLVYPFVQKYFEKGVMIGAVKG